MKITNRILVKYNIIVKTGLHIGGNKETYGIGGIDSPVIKDPLTNEPIIPGSSVKGKIRMLLKYIENNGEETIATNKAFGPEQTAKEKYGISRIIFRDLFLTNESKEELQKHLGKNFFTEIKAENKIDNITINADPRFIERVPAGAIFEGECVIQTVDDDNENFLELLKSGFKLLENSSLGGSGSRGYGKVEINILSEEEI